ncbi:membrane protein [Streptomyces badius]
MWAVRGLTAAVFALAGLIFVTSANTAKGTNLRSDSSLLKLSDLIRERSEKNAELNDSAASVRAEIDALAQRDDGSTRAEDARLKALEKAAGTTEITGDSVSVTLNDAPPDATANPGYPEPQRPGHPPAGLQAVVNARGRAGRAESSVASG